MQWRRAAEQPPQGALSKTWEAIWSPPEFVKKKTREVTSKIAGTGADVPASTDPGFKSAQAEEYFKGLKAGAVEGLSGFLNPGDLISLILSGGTSAVARGAMRTGTLAATTAAKYQKGASSFDDLHKATEAVALTLYDLLSQ